MSQEDLDRAAAAMAREPIQWALPAIRRALEALAARDHEHRDQVFSFLAELKNEKASEILKERQAKLRDEQQAAQLQQIQAQMDAQLQQQEYQLQMQLHQQEQAEAEQRAYAAEYPCGSQSSHSAGDRCMLGRWHAERQHQNSNRSWPRQVHDHFEEHERDRLRQALWDKFRKDRRRRDTAKGGA